MQFQEACARRLGSGFEITCMVWDSTSSEMTMRIAVGTRDKIVQVLVLNANSQLQAHFSVRLDNTVPKSVAFVDNGCVYVSDCTTGTSSSWWVMMVQWWRNTAANRLCKCMIRHQQMYYWPSFSGHAAVNQKRGVFIVDNATNGFTLYRLEGDEEPVWTFVIAAPSVSVPKQVAFRAEGRMIIGGSDHGSVYVFERKSGKLFETLCHSNTGLVQTIAVGVRFRGWGGYWLFSQTRDLNRRCTVASASPVLGHGKATINLWVYNYSTVNGPLTSEESWPMSHVVMFAFKCWFILGPWWLSSVF
jgi:hypothetical protein